MEMGVGETVEILSLGLKLKSPYNRRVGGWIIFRSASARRSVLAAGGIASFLVLSSCAPQAETNKTSTTPSCTTLASGASWDPSGLVAAGLGESNRDSSVSATTQTLSASGVLSGIDASFTRTAQALMSVTFTISQDLGVAGSLTLVADASVTPTSQLPSLKGYPILVKLEAPNPEGGTALDWIQLTSGSNCTSSTPYTCVSSSCSLNSSCNPGVSSAYFGDRDQWEQHHTVLDSVNTASVYTFPTCQWTSPAIGSAGGCAFSSSGSGHFLTAAGKIPQGSYTATFAVMTNYLNTSIGNDKPVTLSVKVIQKKDTTLTGATLSSALGNGSVDVNVILVGNTSVNASRTVDGQRNLDELIKQSHRIFSGRSGEASSPTSAATAAYAGANVGTGIRFGKITAYEWTCQNGGDTYANLTTEDEYKTLFKVGSQLVDSTSEGKALNVFIVDSLPDSTLGVAGGITGSPVNGTGMSGLVFSSFGNLGKYNGACTGQSSCAYSLQDADFIEMGGTMAHEIGHYLSLNHPSESAGTYHDTLPDTPECNRKVTGYDFIYATSSSCYSNSNGSLCATQCPNYSYLTSSSVFCRDADLCQWNHVMWYTSKKTIPALGSDGQIFSSQSSALMNFNSMVQ